MNRWWKNVLHQTSTQFEYREALVFFSLSAGQGFPIGVTLLFRRLGFIHQAFVNRTVRVFFIWPGKRMSAQLNAVRHLEHHPKARWVTDNGRIHHRHGIQI
ncbi:hypothetical protein D3C75_1050110 [compost metagenome]